MVNLLNIFLSPLLIIHLFLLLRADRSSVKSRAVIEKFWEREYIIKRTFTFISLSDSLRNNCDDEQSKVKLNNIEVLGRVAK